MNSSYYSRLDSALKTALSDLVTQEQSHIVSIEFTVMREKGRPTLLQVEILLCEAEQKEDLTLLALKNSNKDLDKALRKWQEEHPTVSPNC